MGETELFNLSFLTATNFSFSPSHLVENRSRKGGRLCGPDSRFQLSLGSQGRAMEPGVGLLLGCGGCLEVSLSSSTHPSVSENGGKNHRRQLLLNTKHCSK